MSTLEELQRLPDGKFHRLCDDLLRLQEARYRRLRAHGINDRDESIVGQPDSYVGDSASTCRIAFCYSVKREGWWSKVSEDVKEAMAASPNVEEVVLATPRDVSREAPTKGDNLDWLPKAKAAAGRASFRLYDGPEIARLLDTNHQGIRHDHLGIPYSRLSYSGILASCRRANAGILAEMKWYRRFDPDRYLFRKDDRQLFQVWQRAWRGTGKELDRQDNVRLIALVNHSGLGKTSLLCTLVECLSPCLPVLLVPARHLAFEAEDCVVRHVVQALQGVLAPGLVREEEAAIVHHISRHAPLTVVLDGLDEAGNPASVRRAISSWLNSRLGQGSILVVSSRREFWRASIDRAWGRWMPGPRGDDRGAATPVERAEAQALDTAQGLRLPGLFSLEELERAWVLTGQPATALHAIPHAIKEELRHPFTLRAFADILGHGGVGPLQTRTDIMAAWLEVRLRAEEDAEIRLTSDVYRVALRAVASRIEQAGQGWVSADMLEGIPRFDRSRPPGPVVERLLQAGILESLPDHPDRIRFVFAAVHDFFLAEVDADIVEQDPQVGLRAIAEKTFSEGYIRLERLGRRIVDSPKRDEFLAALVDVDPVRAALVLRAAPLAYRQEIRQKIIAHLKQDVTSRHRVRGAFAVDMLGRIDCLESRHALPEALPPVDRCPFHLRVIGGRTLARLGCVEGTPFVYAFPWFQLTPGSGAYYFQDSMELLRKASPQFRAALADHALQFLSAESGTPHHGRAVCVLAHLGDERLVANLEERLARNGTLQEYENHALIALGSEGAAGLFRRSVRRAAAVLSGMGSEDGGLARYEVFTNVSPPSADLRYLITPAFEREIERLIQDEDEEVATFGLGLAKNSQSLRLLHCSLLAQANRGRLSGHFAGRIGEGIDPRTWMTWWEAAECDRVRTMLLNAMSPVPTVEVEQVLIDCLDNTTLRNSAAYLLGHFRSNRAAVPLRQLLEGGLTGWNCFEVVRSVGWLADEGAVGVLAELARKSEGDLFSLVAISLGAIGTEEAERALFAILDEGAKPEGVISGLFLHGSPSAIARAVSEARRQEPRGPQWLAMRMRRAFAWWGFTVGHYYTHIHDDQAVEYLLENEAAFKGKEKWDLIHAVRQIDSASSRRLLRELASREGMTDDEVVRDSDGLRASTLAYQELVYRGDSFAVEHTIREAISEERQWSRAGRDLLRFPSDQVVHHLRLALERAEDDGGRARVIRLLGFCGSGSDAELIRPYVDNPDDHLADTAHKAFCRLTDPLLVPPNWSFL
jgi:hypothetical protein